jgi:hypothetical protein
MIRSSRRISTFVALAVLLALLTVAVSSAQAQTTKPFKIFGVGAGPIGLPLPGQPARPHWVVGVATDLGLHYGEGTVATDWAEPQPDGTIAGEFGSGKPFVFRGAKGDRLVCNYGRVKYGASEPGTVQLTILDILDDGSLVVEAFWIAEFVPVPKASTGKFAGVTGSWIMYAYSEPFVLGSDDPVGYWWEGEGRLTFPKKNKK